MLRSIPNRIGNTLIRSQIIGMKNLDRKNPTLRRGTYRSSILAGRRYYSSTARAVNIVAAHLIERKLKTLWARIKMIGMIIRQEEVAPDLVGCSLIWVLPDA